MLIEIPIKVRVELDANSIIDDSGITIEKMTISIDYIQNIVKIPVEGECMLYTVGGDNYVVILSYDEMVTLWRKAIDMSSESCLIKAEQNPVIKHSMN